MALSRRQARGAPPAFPLSPLSCCLAPYFLRTRAAPLLCCTPLVCAVLPSVLVDKVSLRKREVATPPPLSPANSFIGLVTLAFFLLPSSPPPAIGRSRIAFRPAAQHDDEIRHVTSRQDTTATAQSRRRGSLRENQDEWRPHLSNRFSTGACPQVGPPRRRRRAARPHRRRPTSSGPT